MPSIDLFVQLESVATAIGAVMAAAGLIYAGIQLRASRKIARGEFLLRLDELFHPYNEVHTQLRPGGAWAEGRGGPTSVEEWVAVERYMGLFERIKTLVDDGIVGLDTVDKLYGYRVFNIAANAIIHQAKLVRESESWEDFIELWHALERHRKKRLAKQRKRDV